MEQRRKRGQRQMIFRMMNVASGAADSEQRWTITHIHRLTVRRAKHMGGSHVKKE